MECSKMSYARKAAGQAVIVFFFAMLASLFGYLIRILFARNLGADDYGLFYAGIALISLLVLFIDFGTSSSLQKFIAEFRSKRKKKDIKSLTSILLVFQTGMSLIIAAIVMLFSVFLSSHYFHSEGASMLIILFAVLLILHNMERFYKFLFIGFQKSHYFTFSTMVKNALILVFALLLFIKTSSVTAAILSYIISFFLVFAGSTIVFIRNLFPGFTRIRAAWDNRLFRRALAYGFSVLLILVGGKVITYTDTVMLSFFRTLHEVGIYQAAVPTAEVMRIIPQAFAFVLTPMAASLLARNKMPEAVRMYELIQKYFFVLIIPLALILVFYSSLVLRVLFGSSYEAGGLPLAILAIANLFFTIAVINNSFFYALEKPGIVSRFMLIAASVNLAMNLALIPFFGALGASVATLVSYLIVLILSSLEINNYKIQLPYLGWVKGVAAGIIFTAFLYLIKDALMINRWYIEAPIVLAAGLLAYSALAILFRAIRISEIRYILRVLVIDRVRGKRH